MPVINLQTYINASVEDCFNLSRSVDLHLQSMQSHQEKAIAGTITGKMSLHDTVTWKATHFGLPFKMTVQITEMQHPHYFVDEMVNGPFKWFRHYNAFEAKGNGTVMTDEFVFRSPLGWLGKLVDRWVLKAYLHKLLQQRNEVIKQAAERRLIKNIKTCHCERSVATASV